MTLNPYEQKDLLMHFLTMGEYAREKNYLYTA
ncbi:hypothetical protein J2X07_003195 [Fictibacillus barbaricus]|uniref:Uncharacterized protein n=1 Tax=Fictibacillus barbaricus TaxID=182136 RepID=A0ABU1U3Y0_9BACL|nr:hypothetical protein [Fictibacillus barbaricus]